MNKQSDSQQGTDLIRTRESDLVVSRVNNLTATSPLEPQQRGILDNIQDKKYSVALANMASHQAPLNIDSLYPDQNDLAHVKNSVFYSMSRAVDGMLTPHLVEFNQVQSCFIGAVVETSQAILQTQNNKQILRDNKIELQVQKVDDLLQNQRHQPELSQVYALLGVGLFLQMLAIMLVHFLKNRMINWWLQNAAEHPQPQHPRPVYPVQECFNMPCSPRCNPGPSRGTREECIPLGAGSRAPPP